MGNEKGATRKRERSPVESPREKLQRLCNDSSSYSKPNINARRLVNIKNVVYSSSDDEDDTTSSSFGSSNVLVNDYNASRVRQCAHVTWRMCTMECRREHQEEKKKKVQEEEEEEQIEKHEKKEAIPEFQKKSSKKPTKQPTKQSTRQPMKQSTKQPTKKPTKKPTKTLDTCSSSSNHVLVNDCNASRVRQCAHCHVRDAINGGPHGRMCSMECRREHQEEKERKVQEEEEEEEEQQQNEKNEKTSIQTNQDELKPYQLVLRTELMDGRIVRHQGPHLCSPVGRAKLFFFFTSQKSSRQMDT